MTTQRIERNPRNDADAQLLLRAFPDLLMDGRLIMHDQIETVLRMSRSDARYRTVVTKWRRVVKAERGVYLDGLTAGGEGFVALRPDDMARHTDRRVREAGRKVKRAIEVAMLPKDSDLSEGMRQYRRLLVTACVRIAHEYQTTLREVSQAMAPQRQLPRSLPPIATQ